MSWSSGIFLFDVTVAVTTLIIVTLWKNLQLADENDDDKLFFLDSVGTKEKKKKYNHKNFQSYHLKKTINSFFAATIQKFNSSVLRIIQLKPTFYNLELLHFKSNFVSLIF